MAIGKGPRVGSAHVSVSADGDRLNEQIADSAEEGFDKVEDRADESGERSADRFSDRFVKRLQGRLGGALRDRLSGDGAQAGEEAGEAASDRLRERMASRMKERSGAMRRAFSNAFDSIDMDDVADRFADRLGDRLEESFARMVDTMDTRVSGNRGGGGGRRGGGGGTITGGGGGDDDGDAYGPPSLAMRRLERAYRMNEEFDRARQRLLEQAYRMNDKHDRDRFLMVERAYKMNEEFDRRRASMLDRAYKMNEAFDRSRMTMLERAYKMNENFDRRRAAMLDLAYKMNDDFDRKRAAMYDRAYKMNEDFDRKRGRMLDQAYKMNEAFNRKRDKMLADAYRMNKLFDEGKLDAQGYRKPSVGRDRDRDVDLGTRVGRLFGAGSRNNALNLLGRTIGNTINLTTKLGKAATSMTQNFAKGFKSVGDNASFAQKIMAGFGKQGLNISGVFGSMAKAGPAAAVAIGVVLVVLSTLASVISALIALMTAMISTIVSGLVGAMAVLGGAILAVVAAGGLLTAAFMSMTDAQKTALKEAFLPLRAEMVGIGQIMMREMVPAFGTWSKNLQQALGLAIPVAQAMGKAFADAGSIITKSFSGPGFQAFATSLSQWLPSIVTNLSTAFGNFMNGLLGMFAAIMPYVNQFAVYLSNVTERFSKWANSASGRNTISDWVGRALESLKSLWNFTREFFGFLGDLLFSSEAQNAGNTIFDSLARSFRGFRDNIEKAKKDGSLARWFEEALEFGRDLKAFLIGLKDVFKSLVQSETLKNFGEFLKILGDLLSVLADAIHLTADVTSGVKNLGKTLVGGAISGGVKIVGDLTGGFFGLRKEMKKTGDEANDVTADMFGLQNALGGYLAMLGKGIAGSAAGAAAGASFGPKPPSIPDVIRDGEEAIRNTTTGSKKDWKNPYAAWARSLIKDGFTTAQQIRQIMRDMAAEVTRGMREFGRSTSGAETKSGLQDLGKTLREQAKQVRNIAQGAVNDAARALASATGPKEAQRALRALRRAQADFRKALKDQDRLNRAAKLVTSQSTIRSTAVVDLVKGLRVQNATLAEIARARELLALRMETAQQNLEDAIQIRDSFRSSVESGIKAYGSLVSATAQTINGIEQSLTATDVISNLEDRLAKIRRFQEVLRTLVANGLSDSAYKQLVEAGVDGGSATAEALLAGGAGAIQTVNELTKNIDNAAKEFGDTATTRLYQAGVDAAQGLLDGLKSLDAQLESQAVKLGSTIANTVKRVLGIKSPSRVMMDLMGSVGDGMVVGLNNQQGKVTDAASSLASRVAVSPEVAAHAARQSTPVSGNAAPGVVWNGNIVTPTEDPHAVSMEVLNELTGRL